MLNEDVKEIEKKFTPEESPLGKDVTYITTYSPNLLYPIPRAGKRAEINIEEDKLPFYGSDIWNAYEISWLNKNGKPMVALGEFCFPCQSLNIIESKSFKLYLNSFNQSKVDSIDDIERIIRADLIKTAGKEVIVKIIPIEIAEKNVKIDGFSSQCIDSLDIVCDTYQPKPDFLKIIDNASAVRESFHTNLLKSNCLVTGQPDWGSLEIRYIGKKICREGLLKYIVSLRDHNEFHEQCVERIFKNIMEYCAPESLTVEARYTRRGGLDINPIRTTEYDFLYRNLRLCRQ